MSDLFNDDSQSTTVDYTELAHKFIYRAKIVVRRFWWVIPAAMAMGITYKAIESFLQAPTYRSDARMMVSGRIALPENELYAEERKNFFGTQIELMVSDQVRARAVERAKLTHPEVHDALVATELYAEKGMGSLLVESRVMSDTSIFKLKAFAPQREYAQVYLDAVMAEYINRRNEMRAKTSERTYDAIAAQLKQLESEIDSGEDAIVDFQKENNIVFIQEQGSAAGAYLADLKRQLAELKTESRALASITNSGEVENLLLQELEAGNSEGTMVTAFGSEEDNETYTLAKEQLELLKADLEEFQIYLKPKHPKVIGLKDQIERTSNQLEIFRRQAFERIGERKLVVEQQIGNLNQEIEIWEQSALENGRLIAEFERLQSRLERSKAAYERNQEALRAIDTGQSLSQETVSVLEDARPAYPAGKGIVARFIEGTAIGLILAAGVLFLISFLDNRVFSGTDISNEFGEPLIGAIPFEEENDGDPSSVLLKRNDDRFVFAEACRNLRTSVFFMGDESVKPSIFAVRCAHTQIRQIKPAIGRLKERGIDVDGIVLNYVDTTQPGYYYYRYSEYYTSPQKSEENLKSITSA